MKLVSLALVSAIGVAAWPSSPAQACSATMCLNVDVSPAAGTLPANMARLRFNFGFASAPTAALPAAHLYRMDGSAKIELRFDSEPIHNGAVWIEPAEAQPVGTVLVFEQAAPNCASQTTYTVTEAKPLPTALGTLVATPKRGEIAVASGGSCTETVDAAYTDFSVQLSADALPYASLFAYQTYIDGQSFYRFSSNTSTGEGLPQGQERTFTICDDDPNQRGMANELSPGTHRIRFEATLPDGTKLATPELTFEQTCPGPSTSLDAGEDDGSCSLASRRSSTSGLLIALALLLRGRRAKERT